jgi:urease accessory protein
MSNIRPRATAAALVGTGLATLVVASPAAAHPGTGFGGLADGAAHPFTGLDHLLAMLMVGVLAVLGSRRSQGWRLPTAFIAGMGAGIAAGAAGWTFGGTEAVIAASLVVLGLAVAVARRFRTRSTLAALVAMGAAHGHAHGLEAPAAGSGRYIAGILLATAILHLAGAGAGSMLRGTPAVRVGVGATVAAFGLLLLGAGG